MGLKVTCDENATPGDDYEACGKKAVVIITLAEPPEELGDEMVVIDTIALCKEHLPDFITASDMGVYFS